MLELFFVANYALSFFSLFEQHRCYPWLPRPFRASGLPWVQALALLGKMAFLVASLQTHFQSSPIAIALPMVSWPIYRLLRNKPGKTKIS